MKKWLYLYKKELKTISFILVVSILIISAWQILLWYKIGNWPDGIAFTLGFIPFMFIPLIMLWQGYKSIRQEWKNESIYFLLTLPCPGWYITSAKLAAGITYFLLVILTNSIFVFLIGRREVVKFLPPEIEINWLLNIGFKLLILYFIYSIGLYLLSQFSALISRFYHKLRGFVSIVVFIISSYLIYRMGTLIASLFEWLPDIPVKSINYSSEVANITTVYLNSAPFAGIIFMGLIMFFLGSWLLAEYLEV